MHERIIKREKRNATELRCDMTDFSLQLLSGCESGEVLTVSPLAQ